MREKQCKDIVLSIRISISFHSFINNCCNEENHFLSKSNKDVFHYFHNYPFFITDLYCCHFELLSQDEHDELGREDDKVWSDDVDIVGKGEEVDGRR